MPEWSLVLLAYTWYHLVEGVCEAKSMICRIFPRLSEPTSSTCSLVRQYNVRMVTHALLNLPVSISITETSLSSCPSTALRYMFFCFFSSTKCSDTESICSAVFYVLGYRRTKLSTRIEPTWPRTKRRRKKSHQSIVLQAWNLNHIRLQLPSTPSTSSPFTITA